MMSSRQAIMQGASPCDTGSYDATFEARRLTHLQRRERRRLRVDHAVDEDDSKAVRRLHGEITEPSSPAGDLPGGSKNLFPSRWKILTVTALLTALMVKGIVPVTVVTMPVKLAARLAARKLGLELGDPADYGPSLVTRSCGKPSGASVPNAYSMDFRGSQELDELKKQYAILQEQLEIAAGNYKDLSSRLASVESMPAAPPQLSSRDADAEETSPRSSTETLQLQIQEMARQMQEFSRKNYEVQRALEKATLDEYELRRELEGLKNDARASRRGSSFRGDLTGATADEDLWVNAASQRVGAAIEKEYSTPSADRVVDTVMRQVATFIGSDRFDAVRRREPRPIETVLLPDLITGSGDCHKIQGNRGDITIRLPYPVIVRAVEIEQARLQLELSPQWAPKHVSVFVTHGRESKASTPGYASPSEPLVDFPFNLAESHVIRAATPRELRYSHRVRFHVEGDSNALCIYRIRVFGVVPHTEGSRGVGISAGAL